MDINKGELMNNYQQKMKQKNTVQRAAQHQTHSIVEDSRPVSPLEDNRTASDSIQRVKSSGNYYLNKTFKYSLDKGKTPEAALYNQHMKDLHDGLGGDRKDLIKYQGFKQGGKTHFAKIPIDKKIKKAKRDITEKVGEINATNVIRKNYKNAKLIHGYEKGVGFDQVWEHNGQLLVVEAKGPGAKLGQTASKGEQMSEEWVESTAKGMKKQHIGKKVQSHLKKKTLKRIVVTSSKAGNAPKAPEVL